MTISGGYAGQILFVDLSSRAINIQPLGTALATEYLGGQGISMRLAYDLINPGIEPLSPENPIIIGAGALCGTPAPSAAKVTVTTKFPVNGTIGTAAGCGFGPQLKWAGYDNVVITGASDKPIYLFIADDRVELCDASDLWGRDINQATDDLRAKHGEDISVIGIGQAGENLIKISLALIDKIATLGRGGLAAVMGAKKLKAVVVKGTSGIKLAKTEEFQTLFNKIVGKALTDKNRQTWIKMGLMGVADAWFDAGIMLVDNKRRALMGDEAKARYGTKTFSEFIDTIPWAPPSCITCDKSMLRIKKGKFEGLETLQSVASEAVASFCLPFNMSINQGLKCADIFNRYGLDLLDAPYLIEVLFDLYKEGLVSKDQLGMDLKLDFESLIKATEKIVQREDIWGTVADGIPALLKQVPGADKFTIQAKGLMPFADGRINLGVETLGMLTLPRGGNSYALVRTPSTVVPNIPTEVIQSLASKHYQIPPQAQKRIFQGGQWDVARFLPYVENSNTSCNCLGLCFRFFIGRLYPAATSAELYHAATGLALSAEEYLRAGERVWNLQKTLNVREGFSRKDDKFPKRWINEPVQRGEEEIHLKDYSGMERISSDKSEAILDRYYEERGWDVKKGIPTKEKMTDLGLGFASEDLDTSGK
jgi:aldehyde:ferredoxin oxidoreductase